MLAGRDRPPGRAKESRLSPPGKGARCLYEWLLGSAAGLAQASVLSPLRHCQGDGRFRRDAALGARALPSRSARRARSDTSDESERAVGLDLAGSSTVEGASNRPRHFPVSVKAGLSRRLRRRLQRVGAYLLVAVAVGQRRGAGMVAAPVVEAESYAGARRRRVSRFRRRSPPGGCFSSGYRA